LLNDCQTIPFKSERQISRKTLKSAQNKISNFKWSKLSWKKIRVSSTLTKLHKKLCKIIATIDHSNSQIVRFYL
jgi:hypothetical protein